MGCAMSIKASPQNSLEGGAVDPRITLSWSTDSGVKKHIDVTLNTAHFKLSIRVQSCPPSNVEADDRRKDAPIMANRAGDTNSDR